MQDRGLKQKALKLSIANGWLPQLEVDVQPINALTPQAPLVTDLDVYSSVPDPFQGYRTVVFDCKTRAKESPVNRCLWMCGVLRRLKAEQGLCILRKDSIELDHRLMAARLGVILLAEDEFDLFATATSRRYGAQLGNVADIDLWEQMFSIPQRYVQLEPALRFIRSTYWMIDDAAEGCRKALATLRGIHPELDPARPEHVALYLEFCSIFARSLAIVSCGLFKAYLHPANANDLSDALLVMLYGGRDAYDHRNQLFKLARGQVADQDESALSLPEWDRFTQLVRQLLDSPMDVQRVPLMLRELGFCLLRQEKSFEFLQALCGESPQGAKFAMLITDYLCKAAKLPPEFGRIAEDAVLSQLQVK